MEALLHDIATAEGPRQAAGSLLASAMALLNAEQGAVEFLELENAKFLKYVEQGSSEEKDPAIFFWIRRKKTRVGRVVLQVPPGMRPSALEAADMVQPLVDFGVYIYDWRMRRRATEAAIEVINNDVSEESFYDDLMSMTALASQMEYIALREYDNKRDTLVTLSQHGFLVEDVSELDIVGAVDTPGFKECLVEDRHIVVPTMTRKSHPGLKAIPILAPVKSFVACPLEGEEGPVGVLSFASSIQYEYSYDEVARLRALANQVSVSLRGYRSFHLAKERAASFTQAATAITGVEVAQAARHEARGAIDRAGTHLVVLSERLSKAFAANSEIRDEFDLIVASLEDVEMTLEKIKMATNPPTKDRSPTKLSQIWDEAKSAVSGRLGLAHVGRISRIGPDPQITVAPDWFRQVFVNLLLNSAEAYIASSVPRARREVILSTDTIHHRASQFEIRYTDYAGGIDASRLRAPDQSLLALPVEQAIFKQGVTGKRTGSGWGLHITRKVLDDYGGSIDLVGNRGGATFRISLPASLLSG